jgi:LacI family transcriptional regulator
MVGLKDVAALAGVSTATVSRVINATSPVNAQTRTLVEKAIQDLNFRPNRAAQMLKRQASQTVGVVVNRFDSPYFGAILEGVDQALREVGFKTIAEASNETEQGQIDALASLSARQCESFVVHADAVTEDKLSALLLQHPTAVLVNREVPGFETRCVKLDNVRAGRKAAEHLLQLGHTKVATVTGPLHLNEIRDRHIGFTTQFAQQGHPIDPDLTFTGNLSQGGGYSAINALLDANTSASAVFLHNDMMAAGGLQACYERGVRVPQDLSFIGFDDLDFAQFMNPPLTTVRQPMREIGAAAGQLAHALLDPKFDASTYQKPFKADVVHRASVADLTP